MPTKQQQIYELLVCFYFLVWNKIFYLKNCFKETFISPYEIYIMKFHIGYTFKLIILNQKIHYWIFSILKIKSTLLQKNKRKFRNGSLSKFLLRALKNFNSFSTIYWWADIDLIINSVSLKRFMRDSTCWILCQYSICEIIFDLELLYI